LDLNAKTEREETYQGLAGRHILHFNTNNNGQKLVVFVAAKNVVVCSNSYPHTEVHNQIKR
jgi:hypothetical protein